MHRHLRWIVPAVVLSATALGLPGCSKSPTVPPKHVDLSPETLLTFAPVNFDTTSFRIHFYWNAFDNDGEVVRYRFAVDADTAKPLTQWVSTTSKDTSLIFQVDPVKEFRLHVFKVAAEDNDGRIDPTPAVRFFSAKTIPPTSRITLGPAASGPIIGTNFTYQWEGTDPDGGETGGKAPVDSFEYLLLLVGAVADTLSPPPPWHVPLPGYSQTTYQNLLNQAIADSLPYPHGDWKWKGIRASRNRFRNVTPGEYVFAIRAVDIAGATEKNLVFATNWTHFTVSSRNPGPTLEVNSSVLTRPLPPNNGPDDIARRPLQLFAGETVSFTWSADASSYGGEIIGYTFALDDTSSFPGLDRFRTATTFTPSQLTVSGNLPTPHFLFVRAVDDAGLTTNVKVPLLIIPPRFKQPGVQREVLFVDDSQSSRRDATGDGIYPSDAVEDAYYTLSEPGRPKMLTRVSETYGIPITQWDTALAAAGTPDRRRQPEPKDLANFTTVFWITDLNDIAGQEIALWRTLVGGSYSDLGGYLRAGGTLVVSGWELTENSTAPHGLLSLNSSNGICAGVQFGSDNYKSSFFPRAFMGVDGTIPSDQGRRFLGSKDFVEGRVTPVGAALGFVDAEVDTGDGINSKWNTFYSPLTPPDILDTQYSPGLPRIEGWIMARDFACEAEQEVFQVEPNVPGKISEPLFTYHGVNMGLAEDQGPSPRENMVVGVRVKSHDLGLNLGGGYNPDGSIGRIVLIGFPLFFVKDQEASDILFAAFTWVNGSPTLPAAGP
jgi:hypothetical protein